MFDIDLGSILLPVAAVWSEVAASLRPGFLGTILGTIRGKAGIIGV
jgi:hypothetical protein